MYNNSSTLAHDLVVDFQLIFDRLPGRFLILAPDTPHYTILAINDELLCITDKTRENLVGKNIRELYADNQKALSPTAIIQLISSLDEATTHKKANQVSALHLNMSNAEGVLEERYWSISNKPIVDKDGHIQYIIHSIMDCTDQVKTESREAKIKKTEKAFQLFMQAPVIIGIVKGPDYTIELANEGMLQLWGRTSDVVGKPLLKAIPELEGQGFTELLDEVRKTGKPYHTVENPSTLVRNGKQEVHYIDFIYHPYYENTFDKEATGVIGVAHDVTEQVLARRKVEESEARYRSLMVDLPIATCQLTGKDMILEVANKAMLQIWRKDQSAIGKPIEDLLPKLQGQSCLEVVDKVYSTGVLHEVKNTEVRVEKEGEFANCYFDFTFKPLYNTQEEIYGLLVTAVDVTEKIIAQKQLQDQKTYLQNAIDIANLGTFKVDIASNIGYYSENIRDWFGLDTLIQPMDLIFSKIDLVDRQRVLNTIVASLQSPAQPQHDITYKITSGEDTSIRHLHSIGRVLYTDNKPHSIVGIIQDVTPQIKAKKQLEESESRFRNMIKQAPVAIVLTRGRDMVIESINDSMLYIMHKEREEEVIGKKLIHVLPEVEDQPVLDIVLHVLETGVPFRGNEVLVNLMEGDKLEEHYFNLSYTPYIEEGVITGILHVAIDVTEQVQTRKKIENNEQRVRSFMEGAPFPIGIYTGKDMIIEFANKAILKAWGKDTTVIGKRYADVLPELVNQEILVQLTSVYTTGIPYHAKNRRVNLLVEGKQQAFYFNYNFTPLLDGQGKVYGIMSTAADVTELNKAFLQIEEGKARLGAILQATPECIKIVSSDGTLQFMNTAGLGMIEGEATLLGSTCVYGVIAPEHRALWIENHKRVCEGESLNWEFDIIGLKGTRRRMETHAVPLTSAEGTAQLAVTRDITHRKKSEEALALKNAQLIRINNDLDNFIYTASHDLKAPISNIESLLHALLRTLPPESLSAERVQRITSLMQESVERFKKTIGNLTEVVKLQKEDNSEACSIDISEVIREVLLDLEPMIHSSEAKVEIDAANCTMLSFSHKNIRSIIYNLLSNAIKYRSPERKPEIGIHCQSTPDYHIISVKDNGLGMQEKQVDKLFTMFKRFHDHVEGSGIGLYMVKKMVENAGGRIEVESQLNVGSTFRIYIPA